MWYCLNCTTFQSLQSNNELETIDRLIFLLNSIKMPMTRINRWYIMWVHICSKYIPILMYILIHQCFVLRWRKLVSLAVESVSQSTFRSRWSRLNLNRPSIELIHLSQIFDFVGLRWIFFMPSLRWFSCSYGQLKHNKFGLATIWVEFFYAHSNEFRRQSPDDGLAYETQ